MWGKTHDYWALHCTEALILPLINRLDMTYMLITAECFSCFVTFAVSFVCFVVLSSIVITKTYLYNVDHLKPHFHIVKLGFTGVYIIFLILLKK